MTPGDWIKDPDRYLTTLTTRVERALPPRPVAAIEPTARQVLVLIAQNRPAATEAQIANTYRLQRVSSAPIALLDARAQVYRINDRRSVQSVVTALSSDPRVLLAQRNVLYQRQGAASSEAVRAAQYGFAKVGAPSAHEIATGRGVKIAIIDTGISSDHPDLDGAVAGKFDAIGGKDQTPDMHGTAIAGIVRARGLVSGIAPDAALLAVRAFVSAPKRTLPESTSFILLRALDWSVREGAHVINMSFSGNRDPVIEQIIAEATRRNVILIAAAGNGGPKAPPSYPAAYENVIAVTAHDRADKLYVHANHGTYISVAAPGVDILVPVLKNGHMFMSGTSMSAAYVSGIVALMLERAPGMTPETALRLLAETAEDLGQPGPDREFGAGRVQARAALDAMLAQAKEIGSRQ